MAGRKPGRKGSKKAEAAKILGRITEADQFKADMQLLVREVFTRLGGVGNFAQILVDEITMCQPGQQARSRALDTVTRALKYIDTKSPPSTAAGDLTNDDLDRELQDLLEKQER